MLEYFTYKKVKKHREEKSEKQKEEKGKGKEKEDGSSTSGLKINSPEATIQPSPDEVPPILDSDDEKFLEHLTSPSVTSLNDDDETPPPLPPRIKTPVIDLDSDASSFASLKDDKTVSAKEEKSKGKDKDKSKLKKHESDDKKDKDKDKDHKPKRFSFANISLKRKPKDTSASAQHLAVPSTTADPDPEREVRKEETDIARVLEDLNLATSPDGSGKAFSLSREGAETVRKFTQVLKDLVNGVPTAYGDLVRLIEDRDGVLARSYDKLPKSLKKLVAQLPEKLTSSLAPELLAVAAEAQGLATAEAKEGAAKKMLSPGNLMELITKPGAVVGLLKGIVNALKVRWPAFVGTNVLWSVAVFLLLSMLWYCYKRGREVRLEKEATDAAAASTAAALGGEREIVEVQDGEGDGAKKTLGEADTTGPRLEEVFAEPQSQSQPVPVISSTAPK
ncbi:hypothetical protein F4819DRAFT_457858 [Hypoxylon fuscum]|nr:hypothetical protein F4819DRAFT_457858 [Hypoxylon fuscum]